MRFFRSCKMKNGPAIRFSSFGKLVQEKTNFLRD